MDDRFLRQIGGSRSLSSERRSRGRGLEELYLCCWYREAERGESESESDVEVLFPFATDSLASLPTSTMAAYPVSSLGPASTPSLSPAKIIASISPFSSQIELKQLKS